MCKYFENILKFLILINNIYIGKNLIEMTRF